MRGLWWCSAFGDPGPCPVDDTPHTACTPESVALQIRVHPPRVLERALSVAPFTQATYRRAVEGKALGLGRSPIRRRRKVTR